MAEKFNMQGGYFSPQGYIRIDTGGSHDENPNGGVQIGVDEQNIPNMLEEDESVYKDYVFSDNIRAEKKFLVDNHIPEKYAGKLYSEIADAYVAEAEDRPLDSISNRGLNAMLGRLAQAQESQKEEKTVSELEKEMSKLTPEELDELEATLAEQEVPVEEQESAAPEAPLEQTTISEEQPTQPQMMAMGGLMHRFDGGTPGEIVVTDIPYNTGTISQGYDNRTPIRKWIDKTIDDSSTLRSIQRGFKNFSESAPGKVLGMFMPNFNSEIGVLGALPLLKPTIKSASGVTQVMDEAYRMLEAEKAYDAAYKAEKAAETVKKGSKAKDAAKNVWGVGKYLFDPRAVWKSGWNPTTKGGKVGKAVVGTGQTLGSVGLDNYLLYKAGSTAFDQIQQRTGNNTDAAYEAAKATDPFANVRAKGGKINRYDNPLGSNLLKRGTGFNGMVIAQDVMNRHFPAVKLQTPKIDMSGMKAAISKLPDTPLPIVDTSGLKLPTGVTSLAPAKSIIPTKHTVPEGRAATNTVKPAMLPTWPRYMGSLTSGIMGLYNAFQKPDQYKIRNFNPTLPSARLHLVDPTFNPMDQNLLVNDVLAANAGTVYALQNSGLGPSTGAAILAADYNTGRNLGDARAKVWDANNQRRNEVLTQRNANAKAAADFDYAMSRDIAQILNTAEPQNIQNNLMQQRLNYAAEGEKYAAIQSNIDAISQALAGIGKENFAMNQVNGDSAYDYVVLPGGGYAYMPKTQKEDITNSNKNGGRLMRPYKKK